MASGSGVSLSAKINGNNIEAAKNLTASAADYTFTNSNEYTGGSLEIKASRSSATKKAIYVYSITVTYSSLGSNFTSYNVTVHYNDGVTSDSTLTSDTATGKITQPNDPEWEGHVFDGWYSDNNTFETPFDFNSEVTSDCDIYAKWLADADLAADVESKISNIGEVSYLKKDQILEARNAYESLTTSQKGLVSNLDVLEAAEAYLNTYVQFSNNLT